MESAAEPVLAPGAPARPIRIALVAGEASGDLLGSLLLGGIRQRWPDAQCVGIAGPNMVAAGCEPWWPSQALAVRGYAEVLRHYRRLVGIRRQLQSRLLNDPPDVFIGIDAPDFNLDLQQNLRAAGIRCVQFVSPSIWAWRPERIEKIRAAVDHVLCIFPFEKPLYDNAKMAASYVGHPLAQVIPMKVERAAARATLGLSDRSTVIALLPGSRVDELKYLAARFIQTAELVLAERSDTEFVLPCVPSLKPQLESIAQGFSVASRIRLLEGQSHTALAACDLALVASGTATLEAALFKRPMVIAYNMHWLSWWLMQRKKVLPWVGLPNILCQDFVVPELLQDSASPRALADALLAWLASPNQMRALEQRFAAMHQALQRDTPALATEAIAQVMAQA